MRPSLVCIVLLAILPICAAAAREGVPPQAATPTEVPYSRQQAGAAVAPSPLAENPSALIGASSYDLLVEGVRLGRATLEVKQNGDGFLLEAAATIHAAIGSLYPISYGGHALVPPGPVQPSEAVVEERKGEKSKTTFMKFPEPGRALSEQVEAGPGRKVRRAHRDFSSERLVLDPFSAMFFLRSRDWRVGEVQYFDLLTGKKQYEVQLTCRGETNLTVDGRPRPVWEIVLQTRSYEVPRKIKLSGIVISLARDPHREVLEITGSYKIGRFVVARQGANGRQLE